MEPSILLLAAEPAATKVATGLKQRLPANVETVPDLRACLNALRGEQYAVLILESSLSAGDSDAIRAIYDAAGTALILEMSFAVTSAERALLQVRAALKRRKQDETRARNAAILSLHNELNASLTGLLLESQLALRQASGELTPTLRHLVELAEELRAHLRM